MIFGQQAAWRALVARSTGRDVARVKGRARGSGCGRAAGLPALFFALETYRKRIACITPTPLESAAEERRGRGASNATEHAGVRRAGPLRIDAVHVEDALVVVPQLWCPETGRPARGRRPASLSTWPYTRFHARGVTACSAGGTGHVGPSGGRLLARFHTQNSCA
jgi:hypothetical protein